jgi:hypothetical protein
MAGAALAPAALIAGIGQVLLAALGAAAIGAAGLSRLGAVHGFVLLPGAVRIHAMRVPPPKPGEDRGAAFRNG